MPDITFPNGSTMSVEKTYKINTADALKVVNNAIENKKDNSDYVIYSKNDALHVAVGKGVLEGHDKNVKLGIDNAVKFKFDDKGSDITAIRVVDKENTGKEYNKAHAWESFNPGTIIGAPAIGGFLGMGAGAAIGGCGSKAVNMGGIGGAFLGATLLVGAYLFDRAHSTTIRHPDIDHLVKQGALVEE